LALYSEQFDNAAWTKTASTTITANSTISPDGTQDADTYTTTASGTGSQIYRVISVSGTTQTLSIFIKYLSGSGTNLRFSIGSVESLGVNLTFSNSGGTLTGVKGSSVNTLNIENYGNNWFRVSISVAYASATAEFNLFRPTGTGTDAYAIWGAQLEASTAYATSYIPTLGTSVTRVVDYAAKGGIGSLLPSQTGTIYVEFDWQRTPDDVQVMSIHNNSTGLAWIAKQSSTQIQGTYFASGYIGTINGSISASSGIVKVAYAWTNGSQAFYVNGVQIGTANASISDSNDLSILELNGFWGITKGGTSVAQTLVFNSRLSNSDLAALTA
jgi:hypothetical protein